MKKQEKEFRSTSRTGAIKLVPIHPFPLRQERIKEEFQNLFIQLEKGIRWGKGPRTEIKKFKVCSFKLKINHDKKELGALKKKKKILSKAGRASSVWGKGQVSKPSGQEQSFRPFIKSPKTKADSVPCFQNFTILNYSFQIIQMPLQQISERGGRLQRKSSKIYPNNCTQNGSREKNQMIW